MAVVPSCVANQNQGLKQERVCVWGSLLQSSVFCQVIHVEEHAVHWLFCPVTANTLANG